MPNPFLEFLYGFQWFVLWFFFALNLFYLLLLAVSARVAKSYVARLKIERGLNLPPEFAKPFAALVPSHNEEVSIVDSVRALLALDYPEFEVIVCNDGSTDRTLERLVEAFRLRPVEVEPEPRFPCRKIRAVYFSELDPRLVVIDKENGGKSDALNAAACFARYPYVCAVDADSLLARDSMSRLMRRFVAAPGTVAVGGVVRLANGCVIRDGQVAEVRMPRGTLEAIQIVEYFRAFLFGRLGWAELDIMMIISGAFGVFRQDLLERIGGWNQKAIGEDMDLVLRLHRKIREDQLPYRIGFVPDPLCWTQAPATMAGLSTQRDRWQRGLMQCLFGNIGMLLNPRYGRIGLVGFPYFLIFEMFGALVEFVGIPVTIACYLLGVVNLHFFLLFFAVSLVWGLGISFASIALAEMSYRRYEGWDDFLALFRAAVLENFGYRQLHAFWRLKGMVRYLFRDRHAWGSIRRTEFTQA